jgi:hypothetical protein
MRSNLLGGVFVCAIGALVVVAALRSPLGTSAEMGPGFFPLMLSVILMVLAGAIIFVPEDEDEGTVALTIPWKGVALVASGPVVFYLIVNLLGMALSVFIVSMLSSFASRRARLVPTLVFSLFLSILCTMIFGFGLNLELPIVGSLFMRG